jgi:transketolase
MGEKHQATYEAWSNALETSDHAEEFSRRVTGELPEGWLAKLDALKEELVQNHPKEATRKSSGNTLEVLVDTIPELIGGSADLTGSNLTKTKDMHPVSADDFSGNYIYYGVREHSMVAAMNGMALHGGFIPYGGTFMVFTDYCRPAIRLAALMGIRSIFVMTHDSIGLGEDGPTHQPVEHLASLRAIPNLNVFRPCDATETAECWSLSLATQTTPSILSLTRQGVPHLREEFTPENKCARGGYLLREQESATVTLIATGSEVSLAVEAMEQLKDKDIIANVVSIPCWELFDEQPGSYKNEVLGSGLRIAIEAASGFGWDKYLGENGQFIGMNSFGASAPAGELYTHFGITTEAIVKTVENKVA